MQTTIRVGTVTRDRLSAIAQQNGDESLDAALTRLIFEHDCVAAMRRLEADPEALADYEAETDALGNAATEVIDQ